MSLDSLKGKVAVVTGAGGTLCSEMARVLAKNGIKVALMGRTKEKLVKVEEEIASAGGTAIAVGADVIDQERIEEAHQLVLKELGPCHILINGAGGNQFEAITTVDQFDKKELHNDVEYEDFRGFFNLKMDRFLNVLEINTMGTVLPCYTFGKDMAEQGGGVIINIASMNTYRPLTRIPAYAMAKAGISNFTQWLAEYLAPASIRVNAIAPGFFLNSKSRQRLTDPNGELKQRGQNIINHTPMNRFGEPHELIGCMKWLIDDEASGFVTGITIPVDGGFLSASGV